LVEPSDYLQDEAQYECNRWFKQPIVSREIDLLVFWKAKQYNFPILAQVARDHLAVPATSAPSECVFSDGGEILTKKRNRISPDTLRWMICLRDWGIVTEEGLEDLIEELSDHE
jgi:hypothetical protein